MPKSSVTVQEVKFGTEAYRATVELREEVLRKPLDLVFPKDFLLQDESDVHFAALSAEGETIGCLILKKASESKLKMRQVAVKSGLQNSGVGRLLVEASEAWAIKNKFSLIELNARETAVPFYLKLGYQVEGELFFEVTLPHFKMSKSLES